jgi:ornithine cyclodeaminase/alanine dehydrogenase-like protein (mu-crystallin family)
MVAVPASPTEIEFINADRFAELFDYTHAIEALGTAFASGHMANSSSAQKIDLPGGSLLVMAGHGWSIPPAVKLLTLIPGNPTRGKPFIQGLYVQFDGETGEVRAVLDGAAVTAARTAALSALVTAHVKRGEAITLAVIGAGAQGRAHVDAIGTVIQLREVLAMDVDYSRAAGLAQHARARGLEAKVGDRSDLSRADVICTCTNAREPLFDSAVLRAGVHINAVGGYTPEHRELDGDLMRRALVIVESVDLARREAGDILAAQAEGYLPSSFTPVELSSILQDGTKLGHEVTTVFESTGMGSEDVVVIADMLARSDMRRTNDTTARGQR